MWLTLVADVILLDRVALEDVALLFLSYVLYP